jgi:Putative protein-S-isoprenylcysteine methyltransferase
MLGLWNLWLFFVVGYGIIWVSMIWANRKRGKSIEDPELYQFHGKKVVVIGWTWLIVLLLVTLFTPVNFGLLFWIGLPFFIVGIALNAISMHSFAQFTSGVNTTGIYRHSRHPMYVGGFFFLLGLCLMGWSTSIWSIAFLALFIISIPYYHWNALLEEAFLGHKYGDSYREYMNKTPRYIRVP